MTSLRTGIIGAMEEEIEHLLQHMADVKSSSHAGITYYEGLLSGMPIVLCKSGVGKVNAAVCTQVLIDRYIVRRIIFTGVAGAVDPQLAIGDLVISTECMQHDMDARALGFGRGEIPYAKQSVFPADEQLIAAAYASSETLFESKVIAGRVLSGDQFIADKATVQVLYEELSGACIEMEGAAVAQVCSMNRIPYVVIRSMSDKADGSAHVNFREFAQLAAERSSMLVQAMLNTLRNVE